MKNKTNEVCDGVMLFARALINDHWADEQAVYEQLAALCEAKVNVIKGMDPSRNR